jgi:F-type H+-transporting ATPase subunit a
MSQQHDTAQDVVEAAEHGVAEAAEHGAAEAAGHGHGGEFDAGEFILHHIMDSQTMELPWGEIHLPTLHIAGYALPITKHVVMMWVVSVVVLFLLWLATRRRSVAPRGLQNLMESMVVFVRDELARKNIGAHGDKYTSYLLSTFIFILLCNLLGLIPYGATATGNIAVTAGLAGMAFLMIQWAGIREFGVIGHFKNLIPPGLPTWLLPIMIPVEILGMFTKPFALCVRLFANMTAGHVVILSLFSLVFIMKSILVGAILSVPFALFINGIELLVGFLQAYIFTMLTSLFIGMSAHPEH